MSDNARPAHSYRGFRRNLCFRIQTDPMPWGLSWYVPSHKANAVRGMPGYRRRPGRWPVSMVGEYLAVMRAYIAGRERLKAIRKQMLLAQA